MRLLKFIAKTFIILLALSVIALAGLYGILQTDFGKTKITDIANNALQSPDSTIKITGLNGSIPFAPTLEQVTIADKNGIWLKISGIKLAWNFSTSPLTFYVDNIEAAKIDVLREPESKEDNEPLEFKLPELPRVIIKRISLPQINVAEAFTGQKQLITVKGSARTFYDNSAETSKLEIAATEGTPLNAAVIVNQNSFEITLNENAGGVIGKLAQINPEESLEVKITGNGKFPSGKGDAIIKTSASDILAGNYEVKGTEKDLSFNLHASLNLPDSALYDQPRKMAGDAIELHIAFDANNKGAIKISEAKIDSANIKLNLSGTYSEDVVALDYSANIIDLMPIANKPGNLTLQGKAQGSADNIAITGQANGDIAEYKAILLDYDVIGKNDDWKINQFGLSTADINAKLDGNINTGSSKLDLNFTASVGNIKKFGGDIGGMASATGTAKGDFDNIDFDLNAEALKLTGLPAQAAGLIGHRITLAAKGTASTKGNVNLSEFNANGSNISAKGKAQIDDKKIKADFTANIPDTTKLEPSLKGSLVANINLDGTTDAPAGKFDATLTSKGQKLDASSKFALKGDLLTLKDISAKTKGININGNAELNTKTSLAESKLNVDASDLSGLQAFTTQNISGSGKANIIASAKNNAQSINASGSFANIAIDAIKIGSAEFKAKSADVKKLTGLDAELNAANIISGENVVEKLTFTAKGQKELIDWKLDTNLTKPEPAQLSANGTIAANLPDWQLNLASLNGNYGKYTAKLAKPATIKQKAGIIDIASLMLNINDSNIIASGQYSAAKIDLKINADDVRLGRFTDGKFRGRADADVLITGSAAQPNVKLNAKLDRLSTEDTGQIPLTVNADVNLGGGQLIANIKGVQDSGHITANAQLPVKFALEPFAFEMPGNSPLNGSAVVDLNLADLANILLPSDQTLRGTLKGNLNFGGTLDDPTGSGQVNLANARYENLSTGTLLENMQAAISTDGRNIVLSGFNAKAGDGNITASGNAGLTAPYNVKANIALKDAGLVNMQAASGQVNGNLDLTGNSAEQLVTGKIIIGPMDINIPEQSNVNVAEVKIRNPEVLPKQRWQKKEKTAPKEPSVMKLNIAVDAPSQVFVRGRGLETEMRGDLVITGTSTTPLIKGQLHTVRGNYRFLDRDLELKECVLDFRGAIPPSPYLNITADAETGEITAGIKLTGSINEPSLKLTSTPALPEDEILAHLLFGRDIKSITPMQGAQLVQALNSLRGGGGGPSFDPVGQMRKAIGVDKLDVDADESGNVTVGAGKYVTDKIYLGVQGGAGENSGKVKAEIEATKSISVEAESGANSNGVRLNWKYDY